MKSSMLIAFLLSIGLAAPSAFADEWQYPVMVRKPAFDWNGELVPETYKALDAGKVTKKWKICFSGTAFKSPVWVAYAYGAVTEAQRLGVSLSLFEAGSYSDIDKQVAQIENCVAQGVDAILIFALSDQGAKQAINEARAKGIVVVDVGNGVAGSDVDGRVVAPYYEVGRALGEYFTKKHPTGSENVDLLWLPGPAGVTWAESANQGLKDNLSGSSAGIVETMYGSTGKVDQLNLVENGLQAHGNIDYIVGIGEAIEAAREALRQYDRPNIKLVSDYITPGVFEGLQRGTVEATVTDSSVMLLRVAVDMAVQLLEGTATQVDAAPAFLVVDQDNLKSFDSETSLAPKDWNLIFQVD